MDEDYDEGLSPSAASKTTNLRLPATCDPPADQNPPKQAVWIVCNSEAPHDKKIQLKMSRFLVQLDTWVVLLYGQLQATVTT
jgi:hypothetical protein